MVASNFFSMCERLEMDSAGRIVIPKTHQEMAGLSTNVVMIGAGKYLDIWDRDTWTNGRDGRIGELPHAIKRLQQRAKDGKS